MPDPAATSPRPRAYRPLAISIATLAVLAVVTLGIVAGRWQYGRYEARADAVRAFDAAQGLPAVVLGTLVSPGDPDVGDHEWRTVSVTGQLIPASHVGLRGRTVSSTAALHHLAWLQTPEGIVLVDIGWVPRDDAPEVRLPLEPVTVTGVLREQEPDDGRRGEGATRIVADQVEAPLDAGPPYPGYIMLREPCDDSGCLGTPAQPVPLPQLSLGPHLSYAYQWWLLALLAPVAAVFLLRRDARLEREARGEAPAPADRPRRPSRAERRGPSDEEIEDAL